MPQPPPRNPQVSAFVQALDKGLDDLRNQLVQSFQQVVVVGGFDDAVADRVTTQMDQSSPANCPTPPATNKTLWCASEATNDSPPQRLASAVVGKASSEQEQERPFALADPEEIACGNHISDVDFSAAEETCRPQQTPSYLTEKHFLMSKGAMRPPSKTSLVFRFQEPFIMSMVLSNTVIMGCQLQYHAENGKEWDGSSAVDLAFCILFTVELVQRICLDGRYFLTGPDWQWNLFDFVVVVAMVTEEAYKQFFGEVDFLKPLPILRSLRILRIVRAFRAFKLLRALHFFRSGRLLIMSIVKGYKLVFWIACVFVSMVYVLALVIAHGSLQHCKKKQ